MSSLLPLSSFLFFLAGMTTPASPPWVISLLESPSSSGISVPLNMMGFFKVVPASCWTSPETVAEHKIVRRPICQ